MNESAVVRVPASTSNCGPGFDTLGLALNLHGQVTVSRRNDDQVFYVGDNAGFPAAAKDMVKRVGDRFFKETGLKQTGFDFNITSDVPVARGLGSSVILRGGILAALNHLAQSPLTKDQQVKMISQIEGHPDNASAAILGGFTVARYCPETDRYFGTQMFPVSDEIAFVVVSPDLEIKTDDSRNTLPKEISFPKVISSINSLAYLVAAFASGNYPALEACRVDHLHEPHRFKSIPQGQNAIRAGIEAGAYTGWLSGSGSSVLCVVPQAKTQLAKSAMESCFDSHSLSYRSFVLQADNSGISIVS